MTIELLTAVGTQKLWKQERIIVHDNNYDGWRFYTNLHGSVSDPIAVYKGAELWCDVTDYVRTYPSVTKLYFVDNLDTSMSTTLNVSVAGLINPESVIVPYQPLTQYGALIIPPTKMISDMQQSTPISAEFYATSGTWSASGNATMALDKRSIGQIDGDFTIQDTNSHTRTYSPQEMRCDVRYAFVKWVSFSGTTRCHLWEIVKTKISADGAFSLLTLQNDYNEAKGRVDSMTILLDGLNQYDIWYYANIITSGKVELSLDGSGWTRVQVTTKDITLPDGEASIDGKLEITLNWKHYDAIAL